METPGKNIFKSSSIFSVPRDGTRKKKLILAFHFHLSNPAGWRCGACRQQGLDKRRACGWSGGGGAQTGKIVWASGDVVSHECPRSAITAASVAWLEMFGGYRVLGGQAMSEWTAKDAEAMALLQEELEKVRNESRSR